MKISVVIPAYNAEKTIARAVDSVLAQTRPADEIIVIDDGSKDHTADIVQSYGDQVVFIQQENAGVSVARNKGIEHAAADWIAFLDADDEWLPEKLKLQSEHLERNPDLKWTYSNFYRKEHSEGYPMASQNPDGFLNRLENGEVARDYFEIDPRGANAWTSTLLVHQSVFDKVGRFVPDMKRGQDNDLWYRIAYQFPSVGYLARPLAIYHADTPHSSVKINDANDFMIEMVRRHEQLSKKYDRYDAFKPCMTHMLQDRIRQLLRQKRHPDIKQLLDQFEAYCSPRFLREMRLRLKCPFLFDPIAEMLHKIKQFRR